MSNTLLTLGDITREALRVLSNNTVLTSKVNRSYDDRFAVTGAKIGMTTNARKPVRYVYASGQGLILQDVQETYVPITLTTQYQRAVAFSTADLALSLDDFSDRIIRPAIVSLANQVDGDGFQLYKQIYNNVGTPGTTPSTLDTYLDAKVKLDNNACPRDGDRYLILNPRMEATIVSALKGLFNPQSQLSEQYRMGEMGSQTAGFDWFMDQNVAVHTIGTYTGAPTVRVASVDGATTLATQGWTASTDTVKAGDCFTIDSVYAVNPQSRQSTGELQQFVVLTNATADGSGYITLNISPTIQSTGANQNVDSLPAASAAITWFGASAKSTPQGLAFHKDALCFANADLPMPRDQVQAERVADKQTGLSIRLVTAYDINLDREPSRLDLLGGWAALRPELACRVSA